MRSDAVARNYAEALFELAEGQGGLEAYGEGIETVARLVDENPRVRLFLETPRVEAAEKKKVLRDTFADVLPRHLVNFLLVVVDKRRQRLLRQIAREYHDLVDERLERAHVEVTVARPLDETTEARVAEKLSRLLDKEAIPDVRVKPEILGGVIVRAGDTIYDGSLRRGMDRMRRRLLAADLPTPERGLPAGVAPPDDPTDAAAGPAPQGGAASQ